MTDDGDTDGADALRRRYGGDGGPDFAPRLTDTIRGLLAHRSVRRYDPSPLPEGTLETLVAAAQSAPTSSNLQAWSVVAVEDPERRSRLAALAGEQDFVRRAPLFLCWLADLSRLERLGEAEGRDLDGLRFLESFVVAALDAGFAAQNAAVAAESLGLGTVYVGALRNRPEAVAAELGLPPNCVALFGLCVGRPADDSRAAVKPRLPQSLVLHRERYDADATRQAAEVGRYDGALAAFSRGNGMGDTAWTPRMLDRVASGASLGGRDRMAEILRALGFGLR